MRIRRRREPEAPLMGPVEFVVVAAVIRVVMIEDDQVTIAVGPDPEQLEEVTMGELDQIALRVTGYRFDS